MKQKDLVAGKWYWIATKGPMRYVESYQYKTFSYGYSYWADIEQVTGPASQKDMEKYREEIINKVAPLPARLPPLLQTFMQQNRDLTLEQAADLVITVIDVPAIPGIPRVSNRKFWDEMLTIIKLEVYGIETKLSFLLDRMGIPNEQLD